MVTLTWCTTGKNVSGYRVLQHTSFTSPHMNIFIAEIWDKYKIYTTMIMVNSLK